MMTNRLVGWHHIEVGLPNVSVGSQKRDLSSRDEGIVSTVISPRSNARMTRFGPEATAHSRQYFVQLRPCPCHFEGHTSNFTNKHSKTMYKTVYADEVTIYSSFLLVCLVVVLRSYKDVGYRDRNYYVASPPHAKRRKSFIHPRTLGMQLTYVETRYYCYCCPPCSLSAFSRSICS